MAYCVETEPNRTCKHCQYLHDLFGGLLDVSKREYWLMTEVFVYLHNGKDYCNGNKEVNNGLLHAS